MIKSKLVNICKICTCEICKIEEDFEGCVNKERIGFSRVLSFCCLACELSRSRVAWPRLHMCPHRFWLDPPLSLQHRQQHWLVPQCMAVIPTTRPKYSNKKFNKQNWYWPWHWRTSNTWLSRVNSRSGQVRTYTCDPCFYYCKPIFVHKADMQETIVTTSLQTVTQTKWDLALIWWAACSSHATPVIRLITAYAHVMVDAMHHCGLRGVNCPA